MEKISEARDFFRPFTAQDGGKERASYLALLHLEHRAREKALGSDFGALIYPYDDISNLTYPSSFVYQILKMGF